MERQQQHFCPLIHRCQMKDVKNARRVQGDQLRRRPLQQRQRQQRQRQRQRQQRPVTLLTLVVRQRQQPPTLPNVVVSILISVATKTE